MATALIVVALLVGGLGAIRWRRRSESSGAVTAAPSSGAAAALASDDTSANDGLTTDQPANAGVAGDQPVPDVQPVPDAQPKAEAQPVPDAKPKTAAKSGKRPVVPGVPGDDLLAASADVDDLDAAFDRVLESHSHELGILLASRLQRLVDRRVPVRAIRDAPGTSAARVCFADGTIVLARGVIPGDFVRIAWGIHASSVWLQGFSRVDATTRLDLRWHEGRVAVVAIGLDQPD